LRDSAAGNVFCKRNVSLLTPNDALEPQIVRAPDAKTDKLKSRFTQVADCQVGCVPAKQFPKILTLPATGREIVDVRAEGICIDKFDPQMCMLIACHVGSSRAD